MNYFRKLCSTKEDHSNKPKALGWGPQLTFKHLKYAAFYMRERYDQSILLLFSRSHCVNATVTKASYEGFACNQKLLQGVP